MGGGLLGMTIAHRLAQQGEKVILYEAADQVGGLASAWQLGTITWDRFYHVILLSDRYTRSLLRELQLEQEIQWVETKTGFYSDGQLTSMSNLFEFLSFPPLTLLDKIRLGWTIFYASKLKNWKMLESQPVADWLRKWSGSNTFEKIWLPLLRAKLGENYQQTSAAFIWATIQRMYAARKSGMKKEMFGYLPGGYGRILERYSQVLKDEKVQIHLEQRVQKIASANHGAFRIDRQAGGHDLVDRVVITLPSPDILAMDLELSAEERTKLGSIQYLGVVCASLLLKKPLSQFYVTNITDPGFPFTGVIEMSALVEQKYFAGHSLVYLPKYVTPDDPIFNLTDQEIQELFFPALMRMHPELRPDDLVRFQVARARTVFALPTCNYSQTLPPVQTATAGIYVLNSAHIVHGTLNVNETVKLAEDFISHR